MNQLVVVVVRVRQRAKDRSGKPAWVEAKLGWLEVNSLVLPIAIGTFRTAMPQSRCKAIVKDTLF
jgi:hypothetical protein